MSEYHKKLKEKHARFVHEYCVDMNGYQAACRAGYTPTNAKSLTCKLLKRPEIQAAIQEQVEKIGRKIDVTAERVLNELAKIAFVDSTQFFPKKVDGRYVAVEAEKLPAEVRAAMSSMRVTKAGISVQAHDKVKALQLLGQYLAMWTDRTEIDIPAGGPLVIVQPPKEPSDSVALPPKNGPGGQDPAKTEK